MNNYNNNNIILLLLYIILLYIHVCDANTVNNINGKRVLARTATGDPVVSANANEIIKIKDISETDALDNAEEEARLVKKHLQDTRKIQRKKDHEVMVKNAQEQAFKNRKDQHRREKIKVKTENFREHLRIKREEGTKAAKEAGKKAKIKYEKSQKFDKLKQEKKLKHIQKKAAVSDRIVLNDRRAWQKSVEIRQKNVSEQKKKAFEKAQKLQADLDRKKKHDLIVKRKREELKARQESHRKRMEAYSKQLKENRMKHHKQKEAARKKELSESNTKRALERKDKAGEKNFKKILRAKERFKKRIEHSKKEVKKKNEISVKAKKARERRAKNYERSKKRQKEKANKEKRNKRAERKRKKEKAKKKKKERAYKKKRQQQLSWCYCKTVTRRWNGRNKWYVCPKNSLLVGWYHSSGSYLNSLTNYKCCHACRKGNKVRKIVGCRTQNWVSSFDRTGWSMCPKGHYISGFYKSSCNWIYCLEYARCCKIQGSRAWKHCKMNSGFWYRNTYAGWNIINSNRFMTGLYRTYHHYLSSIRYAMQCTAYSY